ncbi:MAG: T9SS type A sorting domain-containing protein, partial [Ignavibacteriae bacterium]|nr:T9SS type A sorting domain-containing protein [Ignavibacteriota bacterium]
VEQYYMNVTTIFDDQSNILMSNGDYADIGPSIRPLSGLNTVFSGQNAAGIWRLKIRDNSPNASGRLNAWGVQINNSTIGIQNVSTEIPDGFSLKQNYPNPFNPVTNIKFSVPKTGIVKLKVYDILGKEVAVLVDKQLNAGSYQADFNGSNFSSGVYFYKLEAEGFTEVKKMMLVK